MKSLSRGSRLYVLGVIALAGVLLGWQWSSKPLRLDTPGRILAFVCGVALVALATTRPIRLPRTAHISLGCVFGFAAICLFDPTFGSIVYLLGLVLGYCYFQWRHRTYAWYQILFNVAVQTLSVTGGGLVYLLLHRADVNPVISWGNALAFLLGGFCFVLLNGLLIGTVIGLTERIPIWQVTLLNWQGSFLQFVSHVPLAGIIILLYQSRPWAVLLIILPMVAIDLSYMNAARLTDAARNTLQLLATLVDARDQFTARHSRRVAEYAAIIARQMRIPLSLQGGLLVAARIHDLGKVAIPEALLLKGEELSPTEWERMHGHPAVGAQLIEKLPRFEAAREIILYHHEWFDGRGYPEGRAGDDIPLGSRILAVADALDAMTTDRPYRHRSTLDEAVGEIRSCAGTQFDPQVVDAALAAWTELEALYYSIEEERPGEAGSLPVEVGSVRAGVRSGSAGQKGRALPGA